MEPSDWKQQELCIGVHYTFSAGWWMLTISVGTRVPGSSWQRPNTSLTRELCFDYKYPPCRKFPWVRSVKSISYQVSCDDFCFLCWCLPVSSNWLSLFVSTCSIPDDHFEDHSAPPSPEEKDAGFFMLKKDSERRATLHQILSEDQDKVVKNLLESLMQVNTHFHELRRKLYISNYFHPKTWIFHAKS